jgi:HEAT repeat protein
VAAFSDVRAAERPRFRFFFTLSALIGAAQVVGISASEALFLGEFGVRWLPHTFVAASIVTVAASWYYASVVGAQRNDTLFERMLIFSAVLLLASSAAVAAGVSVVLPALVCLYWANYAVFLNHYWTFTGDYFDTLASKRLFPLFTVGASVGSIAGGAVTAVAGRFLPPAALVGLWALCLLGGALLLHRHRRHLRLWGPLALEEADDTSLRGVRGALRIVRRTPIGRRLAFSAACMVLSLFVLQYLYSDVFARTFETSAELAVFFGVYLLATNVIEVGIELWVTPWVIRRLGVASANVIHPVLTILSFAALAASYRLPAAVAARANRELAENAMAGPIRNLVYNALPAPVRGATRAFLEGVVVYSGMAVAGLVLLALTGRLDPQWLCAAGGATALLYLAANWGVRRQYLRTLVAELGEGRLDFESLSDGLGRWELARLAELWQRMLAAHDDRAVSFAAQLAPPLAAHGAGDALRAGLDHDDPIVRRACVAALADVPGHPAEDALLLALDDEDAAVRLAAVSGLGAGHGRSRDAALQRRLNDPDPTVRAAAAVRLGREGSKTLTAMLDAGDATSVCAALAMLPPELAERGLPSIDHPEPVVRAAALRAATRLFDVVPVEPDRLVALSDDPDPGVRHAAVSALASRVEPEIPGHLAARLEDPDREVRRAAADALAARGDPGLDAAEPFLRSDVTRGVQAAIRAFARVRSTRAEEALEAELGFRVRQAWRALLCLSALPARDESLADRFLRLALADSLSRDWGLAFHVLENTQDPAMMRSVEKALRFSTARTRSDALEVLSNLGDRETAHLMVLLVEPGLVADKLGSLGDLADSVEGVAVDDLVRRSPNRWIRMGVELADGSADARALEDDMEKLLVLKQVPLFSHFTLEQLEAVARVARERVQMPGDVVLREGDPGGDLFLVLSGRVHVYRGYGTPEVLDLGTLGVGSYVGEMAIFDDQPRSATVVAEDETRLLVLAGDRLKELVMQTPEMSFQIFRVLTRRVRDVEARLERAVREA